MTDRTTPATLLNLDQYQVLEDEALTLLDELHAFRAAAHPLVVRVGDFLNRVDDLYEQTVSGLTDAVGDDEIIADLTDGLGALVERLTGAHQVRTTAHHVAASLDPDNAREVASEAARTAQREQALNTPIDETRAAGVTNAELVDLCRQADAGSD